MTSPLSTASISSAPAPRLRRAFVGPGGLRAGWRFLFYNLITIVVSLPFALWMKAHYQIGDATPFTIELLILIELVYLGAAFVAMAVMGRIEGRRFADYGVPLRRAFGGRFWEGALWGLGTIAALALGVAAFGGLSIAGVRSGPEVLRGGLLWLLGAALIGCYEEISFRGYQLFTLADGMGFWPAALLESLYFGWVLHYLEKSNETVMDGINVSLVALFFCLAVRVTGDVWFAAGWHVTFNFVSFFVLGSPNTAFGGVVEPHLLRSSFAGPQWLTGGATGLEASALATVAFLLLLPLTAWRFRRVRTVSSGPAPSTP